MCRFYYYFRDKSLQKEGKIYIYFYRFFQHKKGGSHKLEAPVVYSFFRSFIKLIKWINPSQSLLINSFALLWPFWYRRGH